MHACAIRWAQNGQGIEHARTCRWYKNGVNRFSPEGDAMPGRADGVLRL
ncbi:hypothetical protein [Thiolapillus sp.]|nr:hypothetical protein [Thiolapillus sp.]